MEASRVEKRGGYLDLSRLSPVELGMAAAAALVVSLFLPWFTTSATNPNSTLAGAGGGESVSAFDTFTTLQWLLVAAAAAPLIVEIGLVVAGYLRQALYTDVRKPPGVL
jgi:hypothetical protein